MNRFRTTRWSLVLGTRGNSIECESALAALCRIYRPPVLAYIRGRGHADAEDLTQAFFEQVLRLGTFSAADPGRGRFRIFLRVAVKNFLINEGAAAQAARRGGGRAPLPIDEHVENIADDAGSPEAAFERAWATTVLREALTRLEHEADAAGKRELFNALKPFLLEPPDRDSYSKVADRLGQRRNTIAVAIHRLRTRLHALVREELAETVDDDAEVDAEIAHLQASLAHPVA
jgi:RNA polymerase sigma-70 factor (ECF subfamily)